MSGATVFTFSSAAPCSFDLRESLRASATSSASAFASSNLRAVFNASSYILTNGSSIACVLYRASASGVTPICSNCFATSLSIWFIFRATRLINSACSSALTVLSNTLVSRSSPSTISILKVFNRCIYSLIVGLLRGSSPFLANFSKSSAYRS